MEAKNTKAGKFGIGSTFSFHRTKTITTGEGGMLLLDDEELFNRCKFLRDHGRQPGSYFNTEITFKYMPFNVQAALGYAQFKRIDELVGKKRWILNSFKDCLSGIPDIQLNSEWEIVNLNEDYIIEEKERAKSETKEEVWSVSNKIGFVPSEEYFSHKVSSDNLDKYKIDSLLDIKLIKDHIYVSLSYKEKDRDNCTYFYFVIKIIII